MRSILAYSSGNLLYIAYQGRVVSDGGTMYNTQECTTNKIELYDSFVNPALDIYFPYIKRVALDSGINYQKSTCQVDKIKNLSI